MMNLEKRKPKRLITKMEISEISLVDSGANEGSEVMFWKREHSDPETLWQDFVNEIRSVHNEKLAQEQKHPPANLSLEELKELRHKQPWSLAQAQAAARKTNIGRGLFAMVENVVREREAALLEHVQKMSAEVEGLKALSQKTIDTYDRIERERKKTNMEVMEIEEITKTILDGDITDKVTAWGEFEKLLKSRVSKSLTGADYNQTFLESHSWPGWGDFWAAYSALPEGLVKTVEKEEKRPIGKAMTEINRRAQEMLDKGLVNTLAKGVVRVTESHPELEEQYRQETYG